MHNSEEFGYRPVDVWWPNGIRCVPDVGDTDFQHESCQSCFIGSATQVAHLNDREKLVPGAPCDYKVASAARA